MRFTLPGPAGSLEALIDEPRPAAHPDHSHAAHAAHPPRAAVVFAHPHPQQGGTMHTKAVFQGAKGLTRIGCAVLRFNFRGVGASAGAFDEGLRRGGGFSRGARRDARALSDGCRCGPRDSHSAPGLPSKPARTIRACPAHRRRTTGRPRRATSSSTCSQSTKPKFFVQGESRRAVSDQGPVGVLREAQGTEGAGGDRRRESSVRGPRARSR